MRATATLAISLLALAGCKTSPSDADPRKPDAAVAVCDAEAIATLSSALEATTPWQGAAKVWPGLPEACPGLPQSLTAMFGPADTGSEAGRLEQETNAWAQRACPALDAAKTQAELSTLEGREAVFAICEFDRYGVISQNDASTDPQGGLAAFTLHQWMLDQDLDEQTARPITRALIHRGALDDASTELPSDFQMPEVPGSATWVANAPIVSLSSAGVFANGRKVASLDPDFSVQETYREGAEILELREELLHEVEPRQNDAKQRGEQWAGNLVLVADGRMPFATLADILYSADMPGFVNVLVVASRDSSLGGVVVTPLSVDRPSGLYAMKGPKNAIPKMAKNLEPQGPPNKTPFLTLELDSEGFSLTTPGLEQSRLTTHQPADLPAITEAAQAVKSADSSATSVVVSAEPEVPLSRVLPALAAARGPSCTATGEGCLLPNIQVKRTKAHSHRPLGWPDERMEDNSRPKGPRISLVKQGKAKVKGSYDNDLIRRVVRSRTNEVRRCYNSGLEEDPQLAGDVTIEFTITGAGKVSKASVARSTLGDDKAVASCIARAAKLWKLPKSTDGKDVVVLQPFSLSTKER